MHNDNAMQQVPFDWLPTGCPSESTWAEAMVPVVGATGMRAVICIPTALGGFGGARRGRFLLTLHLHGCAFADRKRCWASLHAVKTRKRNKQA